MSFSINTNVTSLQAQNYLTQSSSFQAKTINSVTSGLRIVNSGDDAAGLAVANGLASDQAVLTQGVQNANNGLATLQTLDGGLSNINTLLDRAQTLATESASGTFSGSRTTLNTEFQSVLSEINRQSQAIGLNQGGQFAKSLSVYIGGGQGSTAAAASANGAISIDLSKSAVDSASLGLQGTQAAGVGSNNSMSEILGDATNKASEAVANQTQFTLRGAGFSDANGVKLAVNLTGVTDFNSLATAVNSAIQSAASGTNTSATALKNANVVASVTTDANGNAALAFSSANSAFQVQGNDQTANALLGNFNNQATVSGTDATSAIDTSSNKTITIAFNGGAAQTYTLGASAVNAASSTTTKAAIAADLNSQASFSALGHAYVDSNGHFMIQSNATGTSTALTSKVDVTAVGSGSDLATALGITVAAGSNAVSTVTSNATGASVAGTVTAGAATAASTTATAANTNIVVRFQGSGLASPVDVKLSYSAASTVGQVISDLKTAVANNTQLQAAGITTGTSFAGGSKLSFTNSSNQTFSVQTAGDTANVLGFGTYALANAASATSMDYTSITGATATTANAASLQFSIAGGASFSVTTGALTGGAGAAAADTLLVNAALAGNSQAVAAGLTASINGTTGKMTISSANGTAFRLNEYDGAGNAAGFGTVAAQSAVDKAVSTLATPQSTTLDAGGAQTTQTLTFSGVKYGTDTQTINITAADSNGVAHNANVVLQNNATSRNGASIDSAIASINQQLQASNDPSLQGIVAVKENLAGQDDIKFMSSKAFQVTSGTSANGVGIGSQGNVLSSTKSSGGSMADISTAQGAQAAIVALTAAVAQFGNAQAAVGRGQNNLNYATRLAQSQLTNEASAESTIKDANLAQEAANLTKAQILVQAGTAALAQANSAPQQLLSLLQGH